MLNLVEAMCGEDESGPAPCKHGNLVYGHAVYCHHKSPKAPRKCPIFREYGVQDGLVGWGKDNCKLYEELEAVK